MEQVVLDKKFGETIEYCTIDGNPKVVCEVYGHNKRVDPAWEHRYVKPRRLLRKGDRVRHRDGSARRGTVEDVDRDGVWIAWDGINGMRPAPDELFILVSEE